MWSMKPGRGPSLAGVFGGIIAALFGVIWTIGAASMGAPAIFPLFGVVFILAAIGGVIYNAYNATAKNRLSTFDITGPGQEPDPLDPYRHNTRNRRSGADTGAETSQPDNRFAALRESENRRSADPATKTDPVRKIPGEFCPFCGEKVAANYDFCPNCGKDI